MQEWEKWDKMGIDHEKVVEGLRKYDTKIKDGVSIAPKNVYRLMSDIFGVFDKFDTQNLHTHKRILKGVKQKAKNDPNFAGFDVTNFFRALKAEIHDTMEEKMKIVAELEDAVIQSFIESNPDKPRSDFVNEDKPQDDNHGTYL